MFQYPHNGTVTDSGEELLLHIVRIEKIDIAAVFQNGTYTDVRMFAAAGHTVNRLCLECNVQTVFTKSFTDNNTRLNFIICRLYGIGRKFPIHFKLFQNKN